VSRAIGRAGSAGRHQPQPARLRAALGLDDLGCRLGALGQGACAVSSVLAAVDAARRRFWPLRNRGEPLSLVTAEKPSSKAPPCRGQAEQSSSSKRRPAAHPRAPSVSRGSAGRGM